MISVIKKSIKLITLIFLLGVFHVEAASLVETISTGSSPHASPSTLLGNILYVPASDGIDVIDVTTNTVLTNISTGHDYQSTGKANQVGDYLYFPSHSSNVDVIDTTNNTFVTSIPTVYYHSSNGMLIGDNLYVPSNGVDIIDTNSNTIIESVVTDENHYSFLDLVGDYLYVPNAINGISVIDINTNEVIETILTSYGYDAINTLIGDYLYLPNDANGVDVIDTTDNTLVTQIVTGHSNYSSSNLVRNYLYVPTIDSGIDVVNTTTNTLATNINTGTGYYSYAFLLNNYLYVPRNSGGIDIIDTTTNTVAETLNTGNTYYSTDITFIDGLMYIPNQNGGIDVVDPSIKPSTPFNAPDLVTSSDTGSSTIDNITSDMSLDFVASCYNDNTVTLYIEGISEDTAVCDNGFATTTATLSEGIYPITYTETNNIDESSESPELSIVVDTSNTILTISSPINETYNPSPVTISGTCEASSTIQISNSLLAANPSSVFCGGGGTYETSVTFGSITVDPQILSLVSIDIAGNISATTTVSIYIDLQPSTQSNSSRSSGYRRKINKPKIINDIENILIEKEEGLCTPYIKSSITSGQTNNTDDVNRLQTFLNEYEGEELLVNGIYDKSTQEAIIRFQSKYAKHVLYPWGITQPTGNVYQTTRAKINALVCAEKYGCPYLTEYHKLGDSNPDMKKVKGFLNLLNDSAKLDATSSVYDTLTRDQVINFQTRYQDTVLKPWGLTTATGYWYKTTKAAAEEILGCSI